jgi:diguanylate cyclase (GGDEF)-like protein
MIEKTETRPDRRLNAGKEISKSKAQLQNEIAELKQALETLQQRLEQSAIYDVLTNLPNRAFLLERLKGSFSRSTRQPDYMFAVLFLDLDNFKIINDSFGHQAGDALLIETAKRLKTVTRPYDTVCRLGGDEFVILMEDIKTIYDVLRTAERIQKEIGKPVKSQKLEMLTSASVGIAISKKDYMNPENILHDADKAMYQAKKQGRACHVIFDEQMHIQATARLQFENKLKKAVEQNEFSIHYQPILSLDNSKIVGFEALARWQSPEGNFIPPSEFIPVAEEIGLIIPIGNWILSQACRQMNLWHKQFPEKSRLAVTANISSRQFTPNLAETIKQIITETELEPECLQLEVQERIIIKNPAVASNLLFKLKDLNVDIHMDDFGTGFSSLSSLNKYPIVSCQA